MTEDEIKNWMRIYAVEILAVNSFAVFCLKEAPDDPLALSAKAHQRMIDTVRRRGFPGVDPAMSDHASAELEDAVNRLMEMASAQIREALEGRKAKT